LPPKIISSLKIIEILVDKKEKIVILITKYELLNNFVAGNLAPLPDMTIG